MLLHDIVFQPGSADSGKAVLCFRCENKISAVFEQDVVALNRRIAGLGLGVRDRIAMIFEKSVDAATSIDVRALITLRSRPDRVRAERDRISKPGGPVSL